MGDIGKIKRVVIHCSDSTWGTAMDINDWHKQHGWDMIGYHFVITNNKPNPHGHIFLFKDGQVEEGRDIDQLGAHVKGFNTGSLGICLIGEHYFSIKQLEALKEVVLELMDIYKLTMDDVFCHNDLDKNKTCPNLHSNELKLYFLNEIEVTDIHQGTFI